MLNISSVGDVSVRFMEKDTELYLFQASCFDFFKGEGSYDFELKIVHF